MGWIDARKDIFNTHFDYVLAKLKISWTEKVSNAEVLKRLNTKRNFVEDIITQKLKYTGHKIRGSAGELPLLVLEGMIPGRRDRGRQRKTWLDEVEDWTGIPLYSTIKRRAESRRRWRTIAANPCIEDGTN